MPQIVALYEVLAEEAQNLRAQVSGFANTQRSISKLVDVFLSDLKDNFKIFTGLGEDLYVFCIPQARRKMGAGVPLACARSGKWRHPVVGLWPLALREDLRKTPVEDSLRKIEVWTTRHGVAIPHQPVGPFQRQHAGRCGPRRAHCVAASRRVTLLTTHRGSISAIVQPYGFGRMSMKAFVMACVAAIVIAVVGGVALNRVPDSAEKAFSSPTGVSLDT